MRIIFLGDVMGRTGRDGVAQRLPQLKADLQADFAVVNGENAAGGYGLTDKICRELNAAGADIVTTGNHVWDQREFMQQIDALPYVLRPLNLPAGQPGRGFAFATNKDGKRLLVIHAMGQLGMEPVDSPFIAIDRVLKDHPLGQKTDAILVDLHAEMTSEKMGMGHFCDGRASLVIGTHTHVPTADTMILPNGTGYQTDAGMCGDYDSVIGMSKDEAVFRMSTRLPTLAKMKPAENEATLCGVLVVTDDKTGLATEIHPLRVGGRLSQAIPKA